MTLHISQTGPSSQRTAGLLAIAELHNDPYHNAIRYAAKALTATQRICAKSKVRCPDYKNYVYVCQYESGSTVWINPENELTVLVDINGNIADELTSAS